MADTEFTELPGPRLTLRRFLAADAPVLAAYRSVPEVARYQSWDTPFPVAAAEEAISGMLASHPDTPCPSGTSARRWLPPRSRWGE